MFKRPYFTILILLLTLVSGMVWLLTVARARPEGEVSGVVVDASGPVGGASVRVRATENQVYTRIDGTFTLTAVGEETAAEITAWADGYYVASTIVTPTVEGITLTLRPYHTTDHPDYVWVNPEAGTSAKACGNCHPSIISQWENNAHGRAIDNGRFFSLYNGTNVSGTVSAPPGYVQDFPNTAGSCASCHAPGAAVDGYLTTNMNEVRGLITSGIHCDYCHKVGGVYVEPATQAVYDNTPGVEGHRLLRPPAGDQIFFGPYDDVADPDTYLPMISESVYCATCHQFSFWGTPIYESYNEWLASPYAAQGVTCQDCHMPPNGDTHFALPGVGGLPHPPEVIPSHLQVGVQDVELMTNMIVMTTTASAVGRTIEVTVSMTNTGAGHDIPTDFPGRHMILVVTAADEEGRPLPQSSGTTVPTWGGDLAGLPGSGMAKILRDVETGEMPVVSYWKQTLIESDTRLAALETRTAVFRFTAPAGVETVHVHSKLIFRRLYQELAEQKGWATADMLLEENPLPPLTPAGVNVYLPLIETQ